MLTAAKAATQAAQKPPLDVSNTSQFRDLANSSSRIFGWNTKAGPQTQFNQVVISQEQLDQIRALPGFDDRRRKGRDSQKASDTRGRRGTCQSRRGAARARAEHGAAEASGR